MTTDDPVPPQLSLPRLFLVFLRFGCLAFGGPVAQIGMLRQALVDEDRWISSARFNRLLAVMQVLPGPEAHELCVHMGMLARGRIGGLLAGVGFMLPGFLLMLLAGWMYEHWLPDNADAAAAMFGIQVAVLAIILRAVHRIGSHALEDAPLCALAAASFAATLLGVPFWLPLAAAGIIYAVSTDRLVAVTVAFVSAGLAWAFHAAGNEAPAAIASAASKAGTLALFVAGLKGGLLTFGGAYTAVPYVRTDTVGRGWLSDASFLDGVALAGTLPAPLVIFATFTGYVVGGLGGAAAITAGMFLPAFAFSLVFFERLEAIIENPSLHRLLTGVAAAVVGVIGATWLQLAWSIAERAAQPWLAAALFLASLFVAWRLKGKLVTPALVVAGGVAGAFLTP